MKVYIKSIDLIVQVVLLIVTIVMMLDDFLRATLVFDIQPIFYLGGWQLAGHLINYAIGREEITAKERRVYNRTILVSLAGLAFLLLISLFILFYIVLYAALLIAGFLSLFYIYITFLELIHAYNQEHENINQRWMNL